MKKNFDLVFYGYLVLPIFIFCFGFLKWYWSLIVGCILIVCIIWGHKDFKVDRFEILFQNKRMVYKAICIVVVWVLLSGIGGCAFQNYDHGTRTAIYRALVEYDWPVKSINDNSGLVYYIGFWLPAACIGKIFGFEVGYKFLYIWAVIGVILTYCLICIWRQKVDLLPILFMIFFSGLDYLGMWFLGEGLADLSEATHLEWWAVELQYSSITTQLFWVFNQSIPAWIAVLLFLQQKDYRTCGFFFALLVPFGPFPMLGFLYLIFCYIIFGKNFDKMLNLDRIKELLTIENFFGCISVLPIVFMYTLNESKKGMFIIDAIKNGNLKNTLVSYILFVILEFLVYIVIINKKNFKPLIMCFLYFAIAPLFYIGGADLGNRSTIPLLIILYLLVIKYLDEYKNTDIKIHRKQNVLIIILMIAFMTNFNEFYRSVKYTTINYKTGNSNFADSYHSFSSFKGKEVSAFITNFVVKDDKSNKTLQWLLRR